MKPTLALLSGLVLLASGCSAQRAPAPARVEVAVTDAGFVPSSIEAAAGVPLTLIVTRKVDATCATGIVVERPAIRKDLPLNQAVEITFTPQAGETDFSCPMRMISGKVVAQ